MPYLWADLLNFFTDDHHPLGDFWYATSILFSFLAFINFFFFYNCGVLSMEEMPVGVCSGRVGGVKSR